MKCENNIYNSFSYAAFCRIGFAEYHTITITDSVDQNGWTTQMTKTYYKDDVTDWISNIIKAKSNSNSESSTATVMELNCINLGSKEKQNIEPSLKFVAHGYQVDGAKEHQIKLKIGTNQLVKHFAVSNNNFELDDATDVIEFIYKNRKQNMIVYFDTNNYAVFELSGLDRLAPDLMECVAL